MKNRGKGRLSGRVGGAVGHSKSERKVVAYRLNTKVMEKGTYDEGKMGGEGVCRKFKNKGK